MELRCKRGPSCRLVFSMFSLGPLTAPSCRLSVPSMCPTQNVVDILKFKKGCYAKWAVGRLVHMRYQVSAAPRHGGLAMPIGP